MKYKYKKFLKAAYINYDEDYCGCGSGTFTRPTVTTPIIVITDTTATIACAVSGATIYYTLDGSTPTSSSTEYTGTITLTHSCTIKAIAVKPGMTDSEVASESYVHYTDKEQMYAYGVQWDKAVENPDVTRIGNMELHRANKLPVQNAMRGCLLDDNGNVVQYLSDSDWQNASLLDGSHGQVMIEIPTFYWKFSEDGNM